MSEQDGRPAAGAGAGRAHPADGGWDDADGVLPRTAGEGAGPDGTHGSGGAHHGAPRRSRTPLLVALAVLVAVGSVVAAVLLLTNNEPEPQPVPTLEPEIVEAPVPTPTVDPVEVPEGTEFFEALPRTVLQFVLLGAEEAPDLVVDRVAEAYALTYGDGGSVEVEVRAQQWREQESAAARLDEIRAQQTEEHGDPSAPPPPGEPGPDQAEDPAVEPRFEEGEVRAGGQEVGRYLLLVREDGTATVWWTNTTALIQLDGPARAVRDMYVGFPL